MLTTHSAVGPWLTTQPGIQCVANISTAGGPFGLVRGAPVGADVVHVAEFEATAMTAVGMRAMGIAPLHEVLVWRVELRLYRPHAVPARCASRRAGGAGDAPVFSACFTEPEGAEG